MVLVSCFAENLSEVGLGGEARVSKGLASLGVVL